MYSVCAGCDKAMAGWAEDDSVRRCAYCHRDFCFTCASYYNGCSRYDAKATMFDSPHDFVVCQQHDAVHAERKAEQRFRRTGRKRNKRPPWALVYNKRDGKWTRKFAENRDKRLLNALNGPYDGSRVFQVPS